MYVKRLKVKNVRSHQDFSITFNQRVTLIAGANGSGKTTLLEAIAIGLQGKSFRAVDKSIIARGAEWYRIDVELLPNHHRTVRYISHKPTGKKQFEIDDKISYRLAHTARLPVVLFEPDDLALMSGSPSRRRRFLDQFIESTDPHYGVMLGRYERALAQRNSLLKQSDTSHDQLFVWDVALSDYGAYINAARHKLIAKLNQSLTTVYRQIAHTSDEITLSLPGDERSTTTQTLLSELTKRHERDQLLGFTSVGPHRDDMLVSFNAVPALTIASRGEVRSIVLALKILEAETITEAVGVSPIILLDDVFSELDAQRQNHLIETLDSYQIIITAATNHTMLDQSSITTLQN